MYWLTNSKRSYRIGYRPALAFILPVALSILTRCTSTTTEVNALLSVDSLISAQAHRLTDMRASLDKRTVLGTKEEEVTLVPKDTTAWLKELEAFSVVSAINKPVNRARYTVSETNDTKSNLRVRSFSTTDDLTIEYVRLYYHSRLSHLRRLEASYREVNSLYRSNRRLSIEFQDVKGIPTIVSYSVDGGQKMVLDDTVQYSINGRVRLTN